MSNQKPKPKPIMMADIRDNFFPHCCAENRNSGMNYNTPVLDAFREGRIIGVPTRWRAGRVIDFRIERAEWRRLFNEGIRAPIDEETEVSL